MHRSTGSGVSHQQPPGFQATKQSRLPPFSPDAETHSQSSTCENRRPHAGKPSPGTRGPSPTAAAHIPGTPSPVQGTLTHPHMGSGREGRTAAGSWNHRTGVRTSQWEPWCDCSSGSPLFPEAPLPRPWPGTCPPSSISAAGPDPRDSQPW